MKQNDEPAKYKYVNIFFLKNITKKNEKCTKNDIICSKQKRVYSGLIRFGFTC
jgi:hypothetical protein